MGLPIVSTQFAEVEWYRNVVAVADSADDFVEKVRTALRQGWKAGSELRRAAVADAAWNRRAQQLIEVAESVNPSAGTP